MPIKVSCPSCLQRVVVPEKFAGKRCKCPRCGEPVAVPMAEENSAPEVKSAKPQPPAEAPTIATTPVETKPNVVKKKGTSRKLITVGRLVFVLCLAAAGVGGFMMFKQYQQSRQQASSGTPWEIQNKAKILQLNAQAEALLGQNKTREAFDKYDAMLDFFKDQRLGDAEIIAVYQNAVVARRRLGQEIIQSRSTAATRAVVKGPATVIATTSPVVETVSPPIVTGVETPVPTPIARVDETPKPAVPETSKPPATAPIDIPLASTRPVGSQDEGERLRDVLSSLLQQGTNALAAGEYTAALDSLQDAKQLFEKKMRGRSLAAGSPEHIALMHGLALAYQLVQKPERASPLFESNSPLDRVCNSKGASRQILVTRAALDATQGYLAMRTVVSLSNYLKEHPDELDSELLDLLFSALQKADERVTNRELMLEPSIKLYESFNSRLEATKPGQKRWGIKWVSAPEFGTNMANRQKLIAAYEAAQNRAAQALQAANAADASLEVTKRGGSPAAINAAVNRLANATAQRVNADKAAAAAKAAIPPVPALTKDDFRHILTPHDVEVVASKSSKSTGIAVADGTSRPIAFSLGGSNTAPKTTPGPTTPAATYEPPPAAPPSRRTFTRSATGFSVGPDLLLTSALAVKNAKRIVIEFPNAVPIDAVVERIGDDGLALLRVQGQKLNYLNLASEFAGGTVQCMAFPEVSVFGVVMETLTGKATPPRDDGWKVALSKHPRLPGAPLLDESGGLVGIEMGERDDQPDRLPAISLARIKAFLAGDAPPQPCANPKGAAVVQITAAFEK